MYLDYLVKIHEIRETMVRDSISQNLAPQSIVFLGSKYLPLHINVQFIISQPTFHYFLFLFLLESMVL